MLSETACALCVSEVPISNALDLLNIRTQLSDQALALDVFAEQSQSGCLLYHHLSWYNDDLMILTESKVLAVEDN